MIGKLLTGLSKTEIVTAELEADESKVKTIFHIQNVPAGVELEVRRVGFLFEAAGFPIHVGINYAWLAFGLVKAENWKEEGDTFDFPKTENVKMKNGKQVKRISVEWLINNFGFASTDVIVSELTNAVYQFNTLKPSERKNWTWPPNSTISDKKTDSLVSGQEVENGTKKVENAETANGESIQDAGAKKDLSSSAEEKLVL